MVTHTCTNCLSLALSPYPPPPLKFVQQLWRTQHNRVWFHSISRQPETSSHTPMTRSSPWTLPSVNKARDWLTSIHRVPKDPGNVKPRTRPCTDTGPWDWNGPPYPTPSALTCPTGQAPVLPWEPTPHAVLHNTRYSYHMLCTMLSSIRYATAHMRCYTLTTGIMQDYTPCTTISCYYYYMHCYKLKALIHAMLHAMLQATRHIHRCKSEKERRHFCFLIWTFLALAQHSLAQHNHMMN